MWGCMQNEKRTKMNQMDFTFDTLYINQYFNFIPVISEYETWLFIMIQFFKIKYSDKQ